jgi:hypothetical protein
MCPKEEDCQILQKIPKNLVYCINFKFAPSAPSFRLFTACSDGEIKEWRAETGELTQMTVIVVSEKKQLDRVVLGAPNETVAL